GELPDADQYGDEGSNTLANVAKAVGGLDLPNLEALGLGNVEPLEGCPPQPGAPAVAGRLLERSKGKDTTTGHWELMGVVTATAFPTYRSEEHTSELQSRFDLVCRLLLEKKKKKKKRKQNDIITSLKQSI